MESAAPKFMKPVALLACNNWATGKEEVMGGPLQADVRTFRPHTTHLQIDVEGGRGVTMNLGK